MSYKGLWESSTVAKLNAEEVIKLTNDRMRMISERDYVNKKIYLYMSDFRQYIDISQEKDEVIKNEKYGRLARMIVMKECNTMRKAQLNILMNDDKLYFSLLPKELKDEIIYQSVKSDYLIV